MTSAVLIEEQIMVDVVGLQEIRWDKQGTVREGVMIFSTGKEMIIINWEQVFCTP